MIIMREVVQIVGCRTRGAYLKLHCRVVVGLDVEVPMGDEHIYLRLDYAQWHLSIRQHSSKGQR